MPIAAIIALLEQYGPTVLALAIKYGPIMLSLAKQYGPTVEAAVWPMIRASAVNGTLEQDAAKLVATAGSLAPLLGQIGSLGELADAFGEFAPVDTGNPTPDQDHLARPEKRGGR